MEFSWEVKTLMKRKSQLSDVKTLLFLKEQWGAALKHQQKIHPPEWEELSLLDSACEALLISRMMLYLPILEGRLL
jgi:hypothetical protein